MFQALINLVLSGIRYKYVIGYMDDLVVWSETFKQHILELDEVHERLMKAQMVVKLEKCEIARDEIQFLGHIFTQVGVRPTPENKQKMVDLPRPKTARQLKCFLGVSGFSRRFCPFYGRVAQPLYALTGKKTAEDLQWMSELERAFQTIREMLTGSNVLIYPRSDQCFNLATDASD